MKRIFLFLTMILAFSGCNKNDENPTPTRELEIRAADLSFLPQVEGSGIKFYDKSGLQKDVITILNENGCNTIRLRIWHTPENQHSSLDEVVTLTQRIKAKSMKVWLDIHYSDTWADPAHQVKPLQWQALNTQDLADSVYNYTFKLVAKIRPDYIQIGNEINSGFLWDNGKITNEADFILLLKKGINAVRDNSPNTKIILHIAGYTTASWFFSKMGSNNVDYDIMGISYYPAWHGKNLLELQTNLLQLSNTYNKPVVIAETAYPFTLGWNDWTNNSIGQTDQLISEYPASEYGQLSYLLKLKSMITSCPLGLGFCYWAPDWVAYNGPTAQNGSSWENMTLFDFENKALDGVAVFKPK